MNVKRVSVFVGTVGMLALAGSANAAFDGMAWQSVDNSGIVSGSTYRLYVLTDGRVDAVAGNSEQGLALTSKGNFFNNTTFGGPTSKSINDALFDAFPTLEWDSYVTIGALYSDGYPFASNELNDVGMDWTNFEAGGDLTTDNGTWFVTPDKPQGDSMVHSGLWGEDGYIGDASAVLIAQVTVQGLGASGHAGTFSALIQGRDGSDTWQGMIDGFEYGAIPAPGALALLGLAGLAGRRRRR